LDHLISPFILYIGLAVGAVGVWLALPRRGVSPQAIGGIVGAAGAGLVILALTVSALRAGEGLPNLFFYIFSILALGASLRVITHPRPVYAALYFIMTILASSGLYLILSAEFMAFALIIVYAGAILITYLFVIMLATQAPTEGEKEALAEYDAYSREPLAATVAGFVLLAVLTTMLFRGAGTLPAPGTPREAQLLAELPGKLESALREARVRVPVGSEPAADPSEQEWTWEPVLRAGERMMREGGEGAYLIDAQSRTVQVAADGGSPRTIPWPDGFTLDNAEGVGFSLLNDHPGSIEIAGVILLMAMLGAVVLARKKVQADEEDKSHQARTLMGGGSGA
jgi:NADH-quinone oxidoreductase subunit J